MGNRMRLFKIALQGLRGRKQDTFLFTVVVMLTIAFMVSTVCVHTSAQYSKRVERERNYGLWHWGAFDVTQDQRKEIEAGYEETVASTTLLGKSATVGVVGTIDKPLEKMANFQLIDGRFPQSDSEVAVEATQLAMMQKGIKVGDQFLMTVEMPIVKNSILALRKEASRQADKRAKQLAKIVTSGQVTDEIKEVAASTPYFPIEEMKLWTEDAAYEFIFGVLQSSSMRFDSDSDKVGGFEYKLTSEYLMSFEMTENLKAQDIILAEEGETVIDTIKKYGLVASRTVLVTKPMTLVGVLETYNDRWDLKNNRMPSAFVTTEFGDEFQAGFTGPNPSSVVPKQDYIFYSSLLFDNSTFQERLSQPLRQTLGDRVHENHLGTLKNDEDKDAPLVMGILALAFLVSAASVFQVYLAQLKRRAHKLTLIRAIGGTHGQIAMIMLFETAVLLSVSLALGTGLGIYGAKGVIFWFNKQNHIGMNWHIEGTWILLAISLNLVAVILGMFIPMVKALRAPLTGEMQGNSRPKSHPVVNVKASIGVGPGAGPGVGDKSGGSTFAIHPKLSFFRISLRHFYRERHKNGITIGMYSFALACLMLSGAIAYWAMMPYQNTVVEADMPNYTLAINFGMTSSELESYIEHLESLDGVKSANAIKGTEEVFLWHQELIKHPLITQFAQTLDSPQKYAHFGDKRDFNDVPDEERHFIDESLATCSYGVSTDSDLFKRLLQNADAGKLDLKAFESGESVILLLPKYKALENAQKPLDVVENSPSTVNFRSRMGYNLESKHAYKLSYDVADRLNFSSDYGIKIGDTLHLAARQWPEPGAADQYTARTRTATVGMIVNDFEKIGLWPITENLEGPVIITSDDGLKALHPGNAYTPHYISIRQTDKLYEPNRVGKSWINIYVDSDVNHPALLTELNRSTMYNDGIETYYNGRVVNNQQDIDVIYQSGLKGACVVLVLGFSISLIALLILYNMTLTKVENEKERIGILRNLGVMNHQFGIQYFSTGLVFGLSALGVAHGIWLILLSLVAATSGLTVFGYFAAVMWQYPWQVHGWCCGGFFVLTVATYYFPIKKVQRG